MFGPRFPTTFSGATRRVAVCCAMCVPLRARQAGRRHDGFENLLIGGAAAQVASERRPGLVFRRIRHPIEQRLGGHDLPRCAEAALEAAVLDERLLDRMQGVALASPSIVRTSPPVASAPACAGVTLRRSR